MNKLTDMDAVRSAIANAMAEEMSVYDLWRAAEHAEDVWGVESAVNTLAQTVPAEQGQ